MGAEQTATDRISLKKLLSESEIFRTLEAGVLELLASEMEVMHLRGGRKLMEQGDPGDCMYIVVTGRLQAYVRSPQGDDHLVGEIGNGESVGEMALITGEDRSATVRTIRDSLLLRVSRLGFERIVAKHPRTMMEISRVIVNRLRRVMRFPEQTVPVKTIALLPGGTDSSLHLFVDGFVQALSRMGSVLHLNAGKIPEFPDPDPCPQQGENSDERNSTLSWFSDQETTYRFVLYEAEPSLTPWTRQCIRQADRIVLVVDAASDPRLNDVEKFLYQSRREGPAIPQELILLHSNRNRTPVDTGKWLASRSLIRHHHLRTDAPADFDRLARILAGKAIGLVLGGGGARGYAHIGVIKALTEKRIPIDMVGGVSVGALIAGMYAMEWGWETIRERIKAILIEGKVRNDMTLPIISMNRSRKFDQALKAFYGETCIEDLWYNFFCVSCNLTTAETVVLRSGPLSRAVRASNAAPVIFPPSIDHGELLVDGGLVNNQPGDIMKTFCGGDVIVVNVSPEKDIKVDPSMLEMPSPWKVLWSRVNPFGRAINVPNIPAVMMRTIMVGSRRKAQEVEAMCDLYLRPPVGAFKLTDDDRIDDIIDAGYRDTCAEIEKWQKEKRL